MDKQKIKHGGKRAGAGRPKGQGKFGTTTKPVRVPENLLEEVHDFTLNGGYKIPIYSSSVQAGYPSMADDNVDELTDMNSYLIKNPATTFCVRVAGLSMIEVGIYEGDVLIVDSSINPAPGKIVVAAIDNMLTVKRLGQIDGKPYLIAENPEFDPIPITENSEVKIWGVVTNVLRSM